MKIKSSSAWMVITAAIGCFLYGEFGHPTELQTLGLGIILMQVGVVAYVAQEFDTIKAELHRIEGKLDQKA